MDRLYDKLISYQGEDYYPFHMPGHKRNTMLCQMVNPYSIDITEIEDFDNLHQMEGVLKHLSERLEQLYGAGKSFPLVNGSTVGILAGISAATARGDKVLVARNCHKSVHHAVVLRGLDPVYIYPPFPEEISVYGSVSVCEVEEAFLTNPDITLVVITSPTYEGIVSDIKAISDTVHKYGAKLLVDEAHGAHLGFHPWFPGSAVRLGADIVIQSLHKTLPAFTQTAVLHSNLPIQNHKIEQFLSIYESSSPSYLLMAGMDRCISFLEDQGKLMFDRYVQRLEEFYLSLRDLQHLKLVELKIDGQNNIYNYDPSKILISVKGTNQSGHQLSTLLREQYHLVMEMDAPEYILGMTSICDTKEGFDRLSNALHEIDRVAAGFPKTKEGQVLRSRRPLKVMLPQAATEHKSEWISLKDSCGRVSAAFVSIYPPGSPLLVPGEKIDQELIDSLKWLRQEEFNITGLEKEPQDKIEVICDV